MHRIELEKGSSSNVAVIGFCEPSQIIEVEFLNGSVYHYYQADKALWERFQAAESKGVFVRSGLNGLHYNMIRPPRPKTPAERSESRRPTDKMRYGPNEKDEQTKFLEVFARNGHTL